MSVFLAARCRPLPHHRAFRSRPALSAVAVTTALAIIVVFATLAAPSLDPLRPQSPPRQCDQVRQQLQAHADAYYLQHHRWPDRQLSQLSADEFLGTPVISCPSSGTRYEMSGSFVACPLHEAEREQ